MREFETIVVDSTGTAMAKDLRPLHEAERMDDVRALGFVPAEVGPMIPDAPARGAVRMFDMLALYPKGEDGFEVKRAGYMGRKSLQRADVFDVMAAKAASRKKASPFNDAQIAMGRTYRGLMERYASAGVKCSSLESLSQGSSGQGGSFIDAVLRDRQQIQLLHRRIGDGSAIEVRRVRPSSRGTRTGISDRCLVDMVCLQEKSITDVLRAHGWVAKGQTSAQHKHIKALQQALRAALDRMMGPVRRPKTFAKTFDKGHMSV